MRLSFLLILLLAFAPEALAKPKRSGASRLETTNFVACVETSVLGSNEGECQGQGETEACVGLRRALELSQMKSKCLKLRGQECSEWGHAGKTQTQWVSIAAAHLTNFGDCVKSRYGSEESNGLAEALQDESLLNLLKKLDDGGKVFGLKDSAVLVRALHGDRFSRIIERSPFARENSPAVVFPIKDAADTPAVLEALLPDPLNTQASSTNPAQEGENYREVFAEFIAAAPDVPAGKTTPKNESRVGVATIAVKAAPVIARSAGRTPASDLPAKVSPGPRYRHNPYSLGLDRSLFERVSSAYQRRGGELRGMEEFIRTYKPEPARDMGELLSRGGTL